MITLLFLLITNVQADSRISFEEIRPILENRCMNCHGHSSTGAIFIDWTDYQVAFEKREELYLRVVELRNMPMYTKMPDAEREMIARWVDQAATD